MSVRISSQSTQYVKVPVRLRESGEDVDPTALTVSLAYTAAGGEPVDGDWVSGSWETEGTRYLARVLTGPDGDVDPGNGNWRVWIKLERSPETIVLPAGLVVVT